MILELAFLAQLAPYCASSIPFETLATIMQVESGFEPLTIGFNGPGGGALHPKTQAAAIATATDLIERQGRSVDLGLMQVNSTNLRPLGLTVADAFDPCRNMAAGARILQEGYSSARRAVKDPQTALRVALSRYNTGTSTRGFSNGYVARVQDAAKAVVPVIRLRRETVTPQLLNAAPLSNPPDEDPNAPPDWDVWARASFADRPGLSVPPQSTAAAPKDPIEVAPVATSRNEK